MPPVSLPLPPHLATSAPIKTAPTKAPWAAAARPGSVAAVLRERTPLGARPGRGRPGGVSGPMGAPTKPSYLDTPEN